MKNCIINQSKGGQAFCQAALRPLPSIIAFQTGRTLLVGTSRRQLPAVAIRDNEDVIWFWIGTHADYDHLLK